MYPKRIVELVINEAIGTPTGREVEVTIIEAGFGNPVNKHYYGADMLKEAAPRFSGTQIYADHEDDPGAQRKRGGVRSTKDLVGIITESWWDETAQAVKGNATILRDWVMEIIKAKHDALGLSISANAGGIRRGNISGAVANIVESIAKIKSVDLVTQAGAGGRINRILESMQQEEAGMALETVTMDDLKEHRSDLVDKIRDEAKATALAEAEGNLAESYVSKDDHEAALTEAAAAQATAVEAAVEAAKTELAEAAKLEQQKHDNAKFVSEALGNEDHKDIPAKSKAVIAAALSEATFEEKDVDGKTVTAEAQLTEALADLVKAKREELAEATGAGKVKGMGGKSLEESGGGASATKSSTPYHDRIMGAIAPNAE